MSSIWTLRRSTTGAVIAGVCAALATRYRIDPLIVRIVAVVLGLSGIGLIPYVALWLLTPRGSDPMAPLHRLFPATRQVSGRTWSVVVVVLTVAAVLSSGLSSAILPAIVIGILWYTGALRPKSTRAHAPTATDNFASAAAAWQHRLDARMSAPSQQSATAPHASPAWTPPQGRPAPQPHPQQQWWAPVQSPTFRPTGRPAVPPVTVQSYFTHPQPAPLHVEPVAPTGSARLARGRRRTTMLTLTTSAAAVGMTTLASTLAPVSPSGYLGGALVGVGTGLVASAWWGRPRWLMPLALGLTAFALVMVVMV